MTARLGTQIDELRKLDLQIAEAFSIIKKLKSLRSKKERRLLRAFAKDDIDGARGSIGVASIRTHRFPQIKDLRKFHKYVLRHKALDLLQNRVSSTAWKARLDEGERVPGIEAFNKISVSIKGKR